MKKIVFIAPRFHTNQAEIVRLLIQIGYEVEFIVERRSNIETYEYIYPLLVPYLNWRVFGNHRTIVNWLSYVRVLRKTRAEYVIIRDPVRIFPILSALICFLVGCNVIFYTQMKYNKNYRMYRRLQYHSLIYFFRARWYTPVHGLNTEKVVTNINRLHYIPFPIENYPRKASKDGIIRVLSVGKYELRKNQLELVKVVHALSRRFDIRLLIVGECSTIEHEKIYAELNSYIKDYKLEYYVELMVNINPNKMGELYAQSDIFVLPSYNEPASISIIEAMAYNLPAIVSDDCGNRDYIKHGETGYYFNLGSIFSLLVCMYRLIHNEDKRNEFSLATYNRKMKFYSPEIFVESFEKLLSS